MAGEDTNIDHIQPRSIGGSNDLSNLWLLHRECHIDRHRHFHPWRTTRASLARNARLQVSTHDDVAEWLYKHAAARYKSLSSLVSDILIWYREQTIAGREPSLVPEINDDPDLVLLDGDDLELALSEDSDLLDHLDDVA